MFDDQSYYLALLFKVLSYIMILADLSAVIEGVDMPGRELTHIVFEMMTIYFTVPSPRKERDMIGVAVVAIVTGVVELCVRLLRGEPVIQREGRVLRWFGELDAWWAWLEARLAPEELAGE